MSLTPRDYASKGFSLLPVYSTKLAVCSCWKGADCPTPGKHPIPYNGVKDASSNVVDIQQWTDRNPGSNWAVACGTPLHGGGYLVVLDIDPRNGGDEALAELCEEHGDLPATPCQLTGGGGQHYFFRSREPVVSFDLAEGVEVKGANSYVLVSPSVHKSGATYRWDVTADLETAIADLPPWIQTRRVQARPQAEGDASTSFLGRIFEALGLLQKPHKNGIWIVTCPWEDTHSGTSSPTSTVLLPPTTGSTMGQFICKHAHCTKKHGNDILNWAPGDALEYARSHFRPTVLHTVDPEEEQVEDRPLIGKFVGDEFRVEPCGANAVDIIKQWKCLAFDEMRQEAMLVSTPGHTPVTGKLPRPWTEADDTNVCHWLQRHPQYGAKWSVATVVEATNAVALEQPYNNIKSWLRGLEWDGVQRLDTWLIRYLDAAETPFIRSVGCWWLLSAVARIMEPGCKVDHMLILEGEQGRGKSTALSILGGEYYTDDLGDISDTKAAAERISGKWIIEDGELNCLSRASASASKSFITRTEDRFRPSYARKVVCRPRTCVFAGTTNNNEYLSDMTGNRRFWPVRIYGLDKAALIADRDQLFAEAMHRYLAGEQYYPTDRVWQALASGEQEQRLMRDPWETKIAAMPDDLTISDVYASLGIPATQQSMENRRRIVTVLQRLGYSQHARDAFRKS